MRPVDAVLVLSFGGPEGPDDVLPFLRRVVAGRPVPEERLAEVAEHYLRFGGTSPITGRTAELVAALGAAVDVPVALGNRFAAPYVADALADLAAGGARHVVGVATTAYGGPSACRAYRDAADRARDELGPSAPEVFVLAPYWHRPGFVTAAADRLAATLARAAPDAETVFTAHSVPVGHDEVSGYAAQVGEAARRIAERAGAGRRWSVAWQSRSGPPAQPWLEPDVNDHLRRMAADGVAEVVLCPIGFTTDHMEVVYDLDVEAAATAVSAGIRLRRSATVGTHPAFVGDLAGQVAAYRRGDAVECCPRSCCRLVAGPGATGTAG